MAHMLDPKCYGQLHEVIWSEDNSCVPQELTVRPIQLDMFIFDGIQCTTSKFAGDAKLGGVVGN